MPQVTTQNFSVPLLTWARNQFGQELRSDFQRVEQYDGLRAKEHLAALRRQSPKRLVILSRVLPLGVFWETPEATKVRNELNIEEREAVEQLRADYNKERERNWTHNLEHLKRSGRPDVKEQFEWAAQYGNSIQDEIAKEWKWVAARAAPGEWGFIADRNWGRITVSLNLAKAMSLSYDLGISNSFGQNIRFHDHYLMVLGIGGGDWAVDSTEEFREKFLKATRFALWHAEEYEAIIRRIWSNSAEHEP